MHSGLERTIPMWLGEDPWLFFQRHRPTTMEEAHWHSHVEINYLSGCAMTYVSAGQRIRVPAERIALFWAPIPHQVVEVEGDGQINCIYVSLQEFMRWNLPVRFRHETMHGGFLVSLGGGTGSILPYLTVGSRTIGGVTRLPRVRHGWGGQRSRQGNGAGQKGSVPPA